MIIVVKKRKPEFEALQFTGNNVKECKEFCRDFTNSSGKYTIYYIMRPYPSEDIDTINPTDWMVKDLDGEVKIVKDKVFHKLYKQVED